MAWSTYRDATGVHLAIWDETKSTPDRIADEFIQWQRFETECEAEAFADAHERKIIETMRILFAEKLAAEIPDGLRGTVHRRLFGGAVSVTGQTRGEYTADDIVTAIKNSIELPRVDVYTSDGREQLRKLLEDSGQFVKGSVKIEIAPDGKPIAQGTLIGEIHTTKLGPGWVGDGGSTS